MTRETPSSAGPDASAHEPGAHDTSEARSVVVAVGEELLSGRTVDSNSAWLGRTLGDLGVPVVRGHTVGDDPRAIRAAVSAGFDEADLVVVTGGLGPTEDDRTRDAVADLLDRPVELDEEVLAWLADRFRRAGHDDLPATNRRQAMVPRGATVLPNPHGTAPGLLMDADRGRVVVLLPGVPREMRGMVEESLVEALRDRFRSRLAPLRQRTLHTTGIAESELAERLEAALPEDRGGVEVAFLPHVTGVDLRLTLRSHAGGEESSEHALDRMEEVVSSVVEPYRYEAEGGDLVEAVAYLLRSGDRTLSVAESCTGGLLGMRLTRFAGASDYFLGGVVAYHDRVKVDLLGIDEGLLRERGAVSTEVAREMAVGVARRTGSDCAVSITGVAGPGGGTADKPVGTVCWGVLVDGDVEVERRVFPGGRDDVRERSAQAALDLLRRRLEGR